MSFFVMIQKILKFNTKRFLINYDIMFYILILLLILMNIYDISYHWIFEGHLNLHQIVEAILLFLIILFIFVIRFYNILHLKTIDENIQKKEKEYMLLKKKYNQSLKHVRKGIEEQFENWNFTEEEKKVARMIILGYSFKQIASILNKSEKTIRNQSLSIYQKSGMINRHDLSGFFLNDFFKDDIESF